MEFAVLLQRELVTPHSLELRALVETLASGDIALLHRIVHDRPENRHLEADGGIADEGNRVNILRLDGNRFQDPDASRVLNLGAACGFMVRERLRYVGGNFPNAVALVASRAVLPPPCRIAAPAFVADKVYLC